MDAKKASQLMKPIYLKDTKAFKYMNWIFLGLVAFSFALGGSFLYYKDSGGYKPSRLKRFLKEYFESDEYLQRSGSIQGLFPPPKKYLDERDSLGTRTNPLSRGL